MPQIIVVADVDEETPTQMFRERVNPIDFESGHSARQLLQRLEWAVEDACQAEGRGAANGRDTAGDSFAAGAQEPELYAPRAASVLSTAS